MGYEVTVYLGEVSDSVTEGDAKFFNDVGMVELCKPGYDSEIYILSTSEYIGEPIFMYGLDGNTRFVEDSYGKVLKAIEPELVLNALKSDKKTKYRRFIMAYKLLKTTIPLFGDELKVVLWGH